MRTTRLIPILILALLAAQFRVPPTASGQGFRLPAKSRARLLIPSLATQASADFDQDHLPDQAQVWSNGVYKSIHIAFGNAQTSSLHFKATTASYGSLFAEDINHDCDPDLVWAPQSELENAVIWLSNGRGQFELAENPENFQTELSRLCADDRNDDRVVTAMLCMPAICSAQSYHVAVAHDDHLRFLYNPTKPQTGGAVCLALENSYTSPHKRGPPPHAI